MELYLMTWPEVETYLKRTQKIIIPVGSTEQHGPTGLIGTDFLSAWDIAKDVGQLTKTVVASPICYGMAMHHLAFPGSASLKPSTFVLMIKEIIESYALHGFRQFYFINGHGGNIAPLTTAFSECLTDKQALEFNLVNWWLQPSVAEYEEAAFGDANGFHATCGEVSVTMACYPQAFAVPRAPEYFPTTAQHPWPLSPAQFRATFPDGRMGSNPSLATAEHGRKIFALAVQEISTLLRV